MRRNKKQPLRPPVPDWEKELRTCLTQVLQPYRASDQYVLDTEAGHFTHRVVRYIREQNLPLRSAVSLAFTGCMDRQTRQSIPSAVREEIIEQLEQLYAAPVEPVSNPSTKGEYGGACNRTACQQPPATWYNHSTHKYYCPSCAQLLNEANYADAQRLFGHNLCTEGEHQVADLT